MASWYYTIPSRNFGLYHKMYLYLLRNYGSKAQRLVWHDYKLILVGKVLVSTGSSVYAGVYVNQILGFSKQ